MARIFHYTSMDALLGIVQGEAIWASDTEFLNDATELKHAIKLLLNRIEPSMRYDPKTSTLIESMDLIIRSALDRYGNGADEYARHFSSLVLESIPQIVSFSKDYDSLNMWRAYAGVDGVCIEFDTDSFLNFDKDGYQRFGYSLAFKDIEYGDTLPDKVFKNIETELIKRGQNGSIPDYVNFELLHELAVFKDIAFREENEVRLILNQHSCNGIQDIRVGAKHLVPYVKVPFGLESIISITVGPSLLKQRNRDALERWKLTPKGDRAHFEIKESTIPYV